MTQWIREARSDMLLCEHCRTECVHIMGIRTVGADRVVRVEDGKFPFPPPIDVAGGRGVQIETAFMCEACRRVWIEGMQFHKGNVYVAWFEPSPALDLDTLEWDIWRD